MKKGEKYKEITKKELDEEVEDKILKIIKQKDENRLHRWDF
jgi:hypothetical protein